MNVLHLLAILVLAASSMPSPAAAAQEHTAFLRGVIDVEGLRAAILELSYTVPGTTNEHRTLSKLLRVGDVLHTDTALQLELLAVDASQMKVTVRENDVEKNYAIPSGPLPFPGSFPGINRLALAHASIPDIIDLMSLLTDRIVLFHPRCVAEVPPQIQCHWTNSSTTKAEAALAIENSWKSHEVATLLLDSNFLILAPPSRTNEILRSWRSPPSAGPRIAPFALLATNEALAKYKDLTGQSPVGPQPYPAAWLYLRTLKPASKAEAIWSIKTILSWGGHQMP